MKCIPLSSSLRVGRGANDSTPKKFTVTKTWRKSRDDEEEEEKYNVIIYSKI
jgi:hypothetical protein